jgi:hypothetical protein
MSDDQLARLREKVEKLLGTWHSGVVFVERDAVLALIDAEAGEPEKCRYCGLPAAYHDEFQMCTQAAHSITKRGPV